MIMMLMVVDLLSTDILLWLIEVLREICRITNMMFEILHFFAVKINGHYWSWYIMGCFWFVYTWEILNWKEQ